jgi:DNA-binding transcriptional MerR regulator
VSYIPKLAAALSGATIRQLQHWRRPGPDGQPVLTPELSAERPILYSFQDVVALRSCVRLRQESSLQKIRRALDALRTDLGLRDHLSSWSTGLRTLDGGSHTARKYSNATA